MFAKKKILRLVLAAIIPAEFFWASFAFSRAELADSASALSPPAAYRALLQAMGEQNYSRAESLLRAAFHQPEIYPEFFETAALLFVYQKRTAEGFAFFDSIRAQGKRAADALGAMGMIRHHEHENRVSLDYLAQAIDQGCRALRPYELFVAKSFEMGAGDSAFQFLSQLLQRAPEHWRLRYALAQWHSSARQQETACKILRQLLEQGHQHRRLFSMLGANLSYLGKNQEALAVYEEGLRHYEAARDDEGRMRMLEGMAETKLTLGKTVEAKAAWQQAVDLARQGGNQISLCRLKLLAGRFLINEQQWLAARDSLRAAEQQAQAFAEGNTLLRAYYHLMNLNRAIGKWEEAIKYTEKTAAVADSIGLTAYSLDMRAIIAVIDLEAGRFEQALLHLRQWEETARKREAHLHRIPFLLSMTKALVALERYEEVVPYLAEGLALAQASSNAGQILDFQINQSAVWLHTGKLRQARTQLAATLAAAQKDGLREEWLGAAILLAEVDLKDNRVEAAQKLLLEVIATAPQTPPYKSYLQLMARLAETYVRQDKLERAIALYSATGDMIATQTHLLNPGGLSALSKEERAIYFGLSRAYLRAGEKDKALAATEAAHDLVVRRKHVQVRLLNEENIAAGLRRELTRMDSILITLRLAQAATRDAGQTLTLESKIRGLEQQRAGLLERVLPMAAVQAEQKKNFPLEEFQRMLKAREELAIKYFVGPTQTLVFFLDGDTFAAKETALGHNDLQALLARIHALLTPGPHAGSGTYKAELDLSAAFEAYQTLLAEWLRGRQAKGLLLVPDDVLHALPFDLLATTPPSQPAKFLVHDIAIRNGVSFSSLLQETQARHRAESVLMLADPKLSFGDAEASSPQRNGEVFLPVGEKELATVRQLIRLDNCLRQERANKAQLFQALRTSDWFHFASHSVSRPSEPLFAEFILAKPDALSPPERAYAFEIFQMQLPTKLAILSACETARGAFFNGEGFEGFVQAFRAAGTPSVIASLWKVENEASAQFFEFYYAELLQGKSTSAALQAAKLKMLQDPRYGVLDWAAFNYYGHDWNVEMPQAGTSHAQLMVLVIIAAAFLSAVCFSIWKKRHKLQRRE
jgi:hypothetical protein